jgi:hypothetical protein
MVEISTAEYAARHGVSQRRVQAAAVAGSIPARRVGGRWLLDDSTDHDTRPGRPLSQRTVRAVECRLSGRPDWADGLSRSERSRLRQRLGELRADPVPWRRIAEWTRAERRAPLAYSAAADDLEDLRSDPRLVAGGVSDPRAGISDAGFLEAHVSDSDLAALEREYLLVRSDDAPNVELHVHPERPADPLPLGTLIFDLARHRGPRERSAATALIHGAVS